MTSLKFLVPALLIGIIAYLGLLSWLTRHTPLKPETQRSLNPCPAKPNCVSSLDQDQQHGVVPLPLTADDGQQQWRKLIGILREMGGEIVVDDGSYAHAVFTSTLFRFKDDVELQAQAAHIQIRSASRAGTSDLGVNRKRVEEIRRRFLVGR